MHCGGESRVGCGPRAEHCAEGHLTQSLCTDGSGEWGICLRKGSDTLQGRMDDNYVQLSAKFRAGEPFQ